MFYSPTEFVFGKDTELQTGALVKKFHGTKALIVYGGGSVVLNHRGRQKSADLDIDGTLVACASLDKAEMLRYRTSFPMLQSADEFFLQEPRPGAFLGGLRRRHE